MKKSFTFLLALFTCFMVVGCGKKEGTTPDNQKPDVQINTGDVVGKKLVNSSEKISLSKDYEQFMFNNLKLEFYGVDASSDTSVDNSYRYVLSIKLGDLDINSNVFSNPNTRYINSDNLSSIFTIYAVDDLYILKSSTGAQINGEYGLIFDNEGNFIKSFENASFTVDVKKHTLDMSKCFGNPMDADCVNYSYKISKKELQLVSK